MWLTLWYHGLYNRRWAECSREQEFAADARAASLVGEEETGRALVYLHAVEELPSINLRDLVETFVQTNQPMTGLFGAQVEMLACLPHATWEEACRKALKRKTEPLDDHPCLKERLKALGISPKQALEFLPDSSGPPARRLSTGWGKIEKELSERLLAPYREYFLARQEAAEIWLGDTRTRR